MPTYEYRCARGHHYERAEGFEAPSEQTCPTCGERSQRQISLPAVIFKGPGFYSTDNRRGSTPSDNGGSSSAPPSSEPAQSDDGGGESKAEVKAGE